MTDLDDTDREILRLLVEDGRRPYSEIAEAVGLSAPAVSDRVSRLRERGVVERFTVDIDRSVLREGIPVLVDLRARPGTVEAVRSGISDADTAEHVFTTADGRVVFTAHVPAVDVDELIGDLVDPDDIREYDVRLLADQSWSPGVGEVAFAPPCAECGNTVTSEGSEVRLDGDRYHFCCPSCEEQFTARYERLREDAET